MIRFWVSVRFWYYKTIKEAETLQKKKMSSFFPLPISPSVVKFYVTEELSFPLVFSYLGHLKLEWPQMEVWCPWSPRVTAPPPHTPQNPWNRRQLLWAVITQEHSAPHASLGLIMVCGVVPFLEKGGCPRGMGAEEGFITSITKDCAALCSLECVCSLLQHSWGMTI